jgi:hypothetical protein
VKGIYPVDNNLNIRSSIFGYTLYLGRKSPNNKSGKIHRLDAFNIGEFMKVAATWLYLEHTFLEHGALLSTGDDMHAI